MLEVGTTLEDTPLACLTGLAGQQKSPAAHDASLVQMPVSRVDMVAVAITSSLRAATQKKITTVLIVPFLSVLTCMYTEF